MNIGWQELEHRERLHDFARKLRDARHEQQKQKAG
jgi:hypothetical protein